jgi:hypothetical protein
VPPRVQIFLRLLSHNKLLTRDNILKRQHLQDVRCLFCAENGSVEHLCFSCDIVKLVWQEIALITQNRIGESYESVARLWISNKKICAIKMTSAIMWNSWKMRNEIYFGRLILSGLQIIWRRIA